MKKTLLTLSFLGASLLSSLGATAQEFPNTLTLFEEAVFYGMYEATVDDTHPIPPGAIRNTNSSYGYKLTEEQIESIGNKLTMKVTLTPRCDNYDRIGNVNLAFVPKGQADYDYSEVTKIEIGRYITPFMDLRIDKDVSYEFVIDNVAQILHDADLAATYDFWIEFEVYGYQGGPGQGGAAVDIPALCSTRNDVYQGKLELITDMDPEIEEVPNFVLPLSFKYELKNYTLAGTDVLDETVRTIRFVLDEPVPNAKFYIITSNHGANTNGEEYVRRNHFIYLDGQQVLMYKPGGVSCVPFSEFNTFPNCIYLVCTSNPYPRPDTNAAWSWNNWCPGDKIPTRVVELGDLPAGEHSFKIDVPDAVFSDNQGYFPMSVYLQGDSGSGELNVVENTIADYSVSPNPTNGIATINSADAVNEVMVYNALGQKVWTGKTSTIDMTALQSGIYVVNIKFEGDKTATTKLVKN